jgi:hypothetical protein
VSPSSGLERKLHPKEHNQNCHRSENLKCHDFLMFAEGQTVAQIGRVGNRTRENVITATTARSMLYYDRCQPNLRMGGEGQTIHSASAL